jgi:hypothetical protein
VLLGLWFLAVVLVFALFPKDDPALSTTVFMAILLMPIVVLLVRGPIDPLVSPRIGPAVWLVQSAALFALALDCAIGGAQQGAGILSILGLVYGSLGIWTWRWRSRARAKGLPPRRKSTITQM